MSQDRAEDRFDRGEDIQIDKQKICDELCVGREDLVKKDQEKIAELKNGGSSGITAEFGKPEIDMDDRYPHFPDLLPADVRAVEYGSRPQLPAQDSAVKDTNGYTQQTQDDNRGAAIPEQVPDRANAQMTPLPWSRLDEIRRRQAPDKDQVEAALQTIDKENILMNNGWIPHVQTVNPTPAERHQQRRR